VFEKALFLDVSQQVPFTQVLSDSDKEVVITFLMGVVVRYAAIVMRARHHGGLFGFHLNLMPVNHQVVVVLS